MTSPSDFTYWLMGLYEISAGAPGDPTKIGFTPAQAQIILDHLNLTMTKVTPNRSALQAFLDAEVVPGGPRSSKPKPKRSSRPSPTYCAGLDTKLC